MSSKPDKQSYREDQEMEEKDKKNPGQGRQQGQPNPESGKQQGNQPNQGGRGGEQRGGQNR